MKEQKEKKNYWEPFRVKIYQEENLFIKIFFFFIEWEKSSFKKCESDKQKTF